EGGAGRLRVPGLTRDPCAGGWRRPGSGPVRREFGPEDRNEACQWHISRADWPKRERRPRGYRLAPSVETGARLPGVRWDQEGVQWTPSPPNARPWRAGRERAGQRAYRGVRRDQKPSSGRFPRRTPARGAAGWQARPSRQGLDLSRDKSGWERTVK